MTDLIRSISIGVDALVRDALAAVDRGGLGMTLVVEQDGHLVGIATDGDLRRALLAGTPLDGQVRVVMNLRPVTALVSSSPDTVLGLMTSSIRHVPLLDEGGRVVDVASYTKYNKIPVSAPLLNHREMQYVAECVNSGWISSAGSFVARFEEMFAAFCGTRFAVSTCNGTVALHLALVADGVGPGDEVIVPTLTFAATASAVVHAGATPVFVDSDPETWCLDVAAVAAAITPRTRAIIPVHLYGHPADLGALLALAEANNLTVIEDAAEAHGARYRGKTVGGLGKMGCFSFYGNKIITTGEGGMVVTNDADLADRLRLLRNHGMRPERRYWHEVAGFNYRLTNLQAAIGVAQIEVCDQIMDAKMRCRRQYDAGLSGIHWLKAQGRAPWAESVNWLYSVLIDPEFAVDRDTIITALANDGIETRPLFIPLHTMPPFASGQSLPVAEDLSRRGLSLPSAVSITNEEIARVCKRIEKFSPAATRIVSDSKPQKGSFAVGGVTVRR